MDAEPAVPDAEPAVPGTEPAAPGAEPAAGGEPVHLDRLGTVQPAWSGEAITVFVAGLGEGVRRRLDDLGGYRLTEDIEQAGDADLVLVSTRLPRGDLTPLLAALRERRHGPLVVLVHTGGEGQAVEVMRSGGVGVVAEGNEEALRAYLEGTGHDNALVDTLERQLAQSGAGGDPNRDRDPATGLPGSGAFEQRLAELAQAGDVPRIAFLRLLHLGRSDHKPDPAANALVRRRLAVQITPLSRAYAAELFALDELEFALLGPNLSPGAAEQLGLRLGAVAATFAPNGHTPLALAMGHAGAEVSQELPTLRELAQRALEVAAIEKGGAVVSADTLSLGVSSTTELEAATRMVAFVEQHDCYPPGHSVRVADIAAELAHQLGYDGAAHTRIRLAGLLHDVGKVGLPAEVLSGPGGLDGELAELYRTHPARGAAYVRPSGGDEVAEAVGAHHEHWDGSGYPDGRAGSAIPVAARIVAVADAYEDLCHGAHGTPALEPAAALAALRDLAGNRLDPTLVEIALPVIARLRGLTVDVAAG